MTLGQKQRKFTLMVANLIEYAYEQGYELTFGDAYRDPRVTYGHANSLHRSRLACDFNLFIDGEYITDGAGHDILHDFWDGTGGSKRIDNDMNHYSLSDGSGMR